MEGAKAKCTQKPKKKKEAVSAAVWFKLRCWLGKR